MRVGIVYDCFYPVSRGGGERVYRRMAELLAEDGHEVVYLTRAGQHDAADAVPFSVVPIWDGPIYDERGSRTIGSAVRFAAAARRELKARRGEFDVVIASALPVLTLLGAQIGLGRRAPIVADWLEVWPAAKWRAYSGFVAGTIATVLQFVGARAAVVNTVNSQFTAERLAAVAPRARIHVLDLVDLAAPAPEPVAAAAPPTAVFLGRLIPDKRAHLIPAAIAAARTSIPELRAVIAGTGPERERILTEVSDLGLAGMVDVPGYVDDATAARLMATAAVLVQPSAREGFGLVIAESAAAGVPSVVIAGEDNAAAELIAAGRNGQVAAGPSALAAALVEVVTAGEPMRRSTRAWFDERVATASLRESLTHALDAARGSGSRR